MKLAIRAFGCLILCYIMVAAFIGCAKKPVVAGAPAATTLDKLSASAFEIANALDSGEKEFEALYSSNIPGVSDDDYAKTVASIFLKAQQSCAEYISQLKTLSTVDTSNRAQVVNWTTGLISSVNTLINEGVVGIKNPDARAQIQTLLAPIPGAIKIITATLGIPVARMERGEHFFTEVKLGTTNRSGTYRAGNSVGGEPARIFPEAQTGQWPYRSTAPGRVRADQRRGCYQDASVPCASQRRSLINPLREAWIFT